MRPALTDVDKIQVEPSLKSEIEVLYGFQLETKRLPEQLRKSLATNNASANADATDTHS